MVYGKEFTVSTKGFSQILDVTGNVRRVIEESELRDGLANVFVIGSTASISTIEFEPALVQDMTDQLEGFAPKSMATRHGQTWGDDNGFSHIRGTFMGPGITVPFSEGELILGTWQQIVVIDHDNRPRKRRIHVQVLGE